MKNKLSSLCIITGLLLGSTSATASYYYSCGGPCAPRVVSCPQSSCKYYAPVKKHHYTHHRPHYYYASEPRHSYYSISTYYVYTAPVGPVLWVPSSCCYDSAWMQAREYDRAFYGPYYDATSYGYYDDYDMDMRTADDVYEW